MPLPVGSISPSAALAAIAASTAEPPAFITSNAIWVASGCEVAAIAFGAYTSLRVAKVSPAMRSAAPAAGARARTAKVARAANCSLGMGGRSAADGPTRYRHRARPRVFPVLIERRPLPTLAATSAHGMPA